MFAFRETAQAVGRTADTGFQIQLTLAGRFGGVQAGAQIVTDAGWWGVAATKLGEQRPRSTLTTLHVPLEGDRDQVDLANQGRPLVCPSSRDLFDTSAPTYDALTDTCSALLVTAQKIDHDARGGYQAAA